MSQQAALWIVFNALVAVMLYVDLALGQKHRHVVSIKEAAIWSAVWVAVSLTFAAGVYFYLSPEKGLQFLTGYLIEKSLSVDNMFVFIMIFSYFRVEPLYQPRVLKWGILGALVMRFVLIFAGAALIRSFHWMLYLFGAFLIYTAWHMAFGKQKPFEPEKTPLLKTIKRFMPLTGFHEDAFFVRINGVMHATSLFLALVVVEFSDLIFALDSIPAIFAITTDTFLVYTSNVFAILGLRALYFLLSGVAQLFVYLKHGVAFILAFVGCKMVVIDVYHVPTALSLSVIMGTLTIAVVASMLRQPPAPIPPKAS